MSQPVVVVDLINKKYNNMINSPKIDYIQCLIFNKYT